MLQLVAPTFVKVLKFDPNQPRIPGGKGGGRWVSAGHGIEHWVGEGTGRVVEGRKFTSEEGYSWHEQGPGRTWAMGMDPTDHAALDSYVGFGYREVNNLRRGQPPTREGKVRQMTKEEQAAVRAARQADNTPDPVPPEGPEFRYSWAYEHARGTPSGPEKLDAEWAVVGPHVDPERLEAVTKQADQLDSMIADRGLVLDEDIVVERGAYLPGVSVEDLQKLETGEDVWEEKAFTSTFLGDAGGRAKSYPALGKWESIMARFKNRPNVLVEHQDEVGTAVRFYITLPKGTKVASAEAARRIDMIYPRKQDPSVFEHPEWLTKDDGTPNGLKAEDYTIEDRSQKPTPRTRDLENKDQRAESEILLGSGARFRVTKVQKGYTYQTGDDSLKPVEVYEVHMEYIGGGSSEGAQN